MKPEIKTHIGLWGAIVFTGFIVVQFVRHQLSSSFGLWVVLTTLPLFAVYIFSIFRRKLKTVQRAFCIWCVLTVLTLCILFIALLLECEESDCSILMVLTVILRRVGLPAGLMTFILWIGLRGLKQITDAEIRFNEKKVITSEKTSEL